MVDCVWIPVQIAFLELMVQTCSLLLIRTVVIIIIIMIYITVIFMLIIIVIVIVVAVIIIIAYTVVLYSPLDRVDRTYVVQLVHRKEVLCDVI